MAIARDTTAANIVPLEGAVLRRGTACTTVSAGELVTLQSDGYWDPTKTTAAQLTVNVSLQAAVAGDAIDLVAHGPVKCLTGATPGTLVYASDTAGEPAATAGTKGLIVGYAESATILFVRPQIIDLT